MKKLQYAFLLFVAVILYAGCTKNEITGEQGPLGATGIQGADLIHSQQEGTLSASSFNTTGPNYTDSMPFSLTSASYMVNVYVSKENNNKVSWYKLPYYNVYVQGDALYLSYCNTAIKIFYYSTSGGFPLDSVLNYKMIVIPDQSTP